MVYIDRYKHIYKVKYVYIHIRARQQLEYTIKSKTGKKRETRPFSLDWYYQPRLKGVGASVGVPPLVSVRTTTRD
jgi:ribosomal protein S19E (S16A)